MSNVRILEGDLLKSNMHALVNTVNTVGVMGKGVALAFKNRYPDMYRDYVKRCERGEVRLGEPYVYHAADHLIVNFPTKQHWRSVSRLSDIEAGLDYLEDHYKEWQIRSLAVPPLGCGNGQLEWRVVGPILLRYLKRLDIPVELYAPHGSTLLGEIQLDLLSQLDHQDGDQQWRLEPWLVAIAETVHRLESLRYHRPVGRVMLQKIVYFATAAGLPTGLEFQRASYGPFAPELKAAVGRLQNNGILTERHSGRMIEMRTSSALEDARASYGYQLEQWSNLIDRLVDLAARFDTAGAEIAATVHYAAYDLHNRLDRRPTVAEVVDYVEDWKRRRSPKLERSDILRAVVNLGTRGWLQVDPDSTTEQEIEDIVAGCALVSLQIRLLRRLNHAARQSGEGSADDVAARSEDLLRDGFGRSA
jgi:O-acetyl-ADP-ribose deacetylase (regulator of RNase III)